MPDSSSWFPSLPGFSSVKTTTGESNQLVPETPEVRVDDDCPSVEIRGGASTLAIAAKPQGATASDLRYQLTFTQTARQCLLAGSVLRMRVGVQGRIIVGPAGAPNQVDVPVRYAVVQEGIQPKTITTKFRRIPVGMPPGAPSVLFTDIEEDLSFPMPSRAVLDAYVVYVGFDDVGDRSQPRAAPKKSKTR